MLSHSAQNGRHAWDHMNSFDVNVLILHNKTNLTKYSCATILNSKFHLFDNSNSSNWRSINKFVGVETSGMGRVLPFEENKSGSSRFEICSLHICHVLGGIGLLCYSRILPFCKKLNLRTWLKWISESTWFHLVRGI